MSKFPGSGPQVAPPSAVALPPAVETAVLTPPADRARVKASEGIIRALRADIASGVLQPGDRLPVGRDLAAFFHVSQPTVREAMRGLEALGLVEVRHGSGVYVTGTRADFVSKSLEVMLQMQQAHILEVFEVRRALGMASVQLAVGGATDKDLDAMEEALRRIETGADVQGVVDAFADFQVALSAAGGNALLTALESVLIRILLQLQIMAYADRRRDWWRKYASELHDHRVRLLDALRRHDAEAVLSEWVAYMDGQHARFVRDRVLSQITLSDRQAIDAVRDIAVNLSLGVGKTATA